MIETEWFCGRGIEDEETRTACAGARRLAARIFICGIALALLGVIGGCASAAPAADLSQIPVHVYERGRTQIRLMPGPCVDAYSIGLIARLAPQYRERLRAIESTWPMRDGSRKAFAGCWIEFSAEEMGSGPAFGMIFEDGQRFVVPKSDLQGDGV